MPDAVAATPPPPEYGTVAGGESSPSPAASPEFEFWMVGKNTSSFPSPALLTAAELFSGGVVLPLRHLQASPADEEAAALAEPPAESGIAPTPDLPAVTFKWKDIFKPNNGGGGEPRERKKAERRVSGNAELININIWPFARSRSAGHSAAVSLSKAKPNPTTATTNSAASNAAAPAPRKVSSAPCSRSSSRGESGPTEPPALPAVAAAVEAAPAPGHASMLRRLVPGRGRNSTGGGGAGTGTGIRLGRPSPVWQLRRNKMLQQQAATEQKQQAGGAEKKAASTATGATDSDDKASVSAAPAANGCRNDAEGGEEGPDPPQGRFGLRTLFSKKVY